MQSQSPTQDATFITLKIPAHLYTDLQKLVAQHQMTPVDVLYLLVQNALSQQSWQQDVAALREQVRADGGLNVSDDEETFLEQLRTTRQELFEAEYAHLYR
jgi:hypothetical protein